MDLSVEYFAGKTIDNVFGYFNKAKLENWKTPGAELHLKGSLRRFTILSSMIANRETRVVTLQGDASPRPYTPVLKKIAHPAILPEHGFAWCDGENIYLPVTLVDMGSKAEQKKLARLMVFFLSAHLKYDSLVPPVKNKTEFTSDKLLSDIYWMIENMRVGVLLRKEYPGIFKDWQPLVTRLLYRRAEGARLRPPERRMEELLKSILRSFPFNPFTSTSPEESLIEARLVKRKWGEAGLELKKYRGMIPFTPWGRVIPERIGSLEYLASDQSSNKKNATPEDDSSDTGDKEKADKEEKSRYLTKHEDFDEDENEEALALNIYDKILSWASFTNVNRPLDDDPEEDNKKRADDMEELNMAEVEKTTNAYFEADLEADKILVNEKEEIPSFDRKRFTYNEWDYKANKYLRDYSILTEDTMHTGKAGVVAEILTRRASLIKEIKRKFEALTPSQRFVKRQLDGDNLDIDAVVEMVVDRLSGKTPDDRLYITQKRMEKDISTLFLVDMSMSTDSWVGEKRIIDHEKEALVVLCEAMKKLKDRYAVYGFSGKSRKNVKVFHIKKFEENYSEVVGERLGALMPYHYTRMGPAIRHATGILKKEGSKSRLLFILSDGKPNDVDTYEGRYGIEDTRMAIKEAEREGITPFCLTVDLKAEEYLPRLFGKGNFVVSSSVEKLARSLPELYARIAGSM
ncbi:MAG: VWA domain-containing protein [Deltaproteobacteria bacterium]|nr:VWA domain-containing protein [Deltaproteobacteria bacterium]